MAQLGKMEWKKTRRGREKWRGRKREEEDEESRGRNREKKKKRLVGEQAGLMAEAVAVG